MQVEKRFHVNDPLVITKVETLAKARITQSEGDTDLYRVVRYDDHQPHLEFFSGWDWHPSDLYDSNDNRIPIETILAAILATPIIPTP
jgi:hypothetical protein